MKVYMERLMESLGAVLDEHVPLPQNESNTNKKKKVCSVSDDRPYCGSLLACETCAVTTPVQLTIFCFHFQTVTQELDEDLISLNEILEVGFF